MPDFKFLLLLLACLLEAATTPAKPHDPLADCWRQQGQPLQANYLVLNYRETVNELEHNFAPWQATAYTGRGTVWATADNFLKQDTLTNVTRQRSYYSSTQRSATSLLYRDYGDADLLAATPAMQQDYVWRAARYAPLSVLAYFRQHHVGPDADSPADLVRYHTVIGQAVVHLVLRRTNALVAEVSVLSNDDLLGDVTTTFRYLDYTVVGKFAYATLIQVEKSNSKVLDEVRILRASRIPTAPNLLTAPASYQLQPAKLVVPEVKAVAYRPHLHFLEMKHTDDRVLVVEFAHFLVVAEAPLSSENGELIIREAQKLAPGKPIRYFVAGHHHPHYLGGLRPFVAQGTTVLVGAGAADYARYLAAAPHTLYPDSLQRHPRVAQVEEIPLKGSKTIADNGFEMQIFCIGSQSAHTNDYLLYYFPSEKLLFEDDLAGISQQGAVRKASARQKGLYQAIKDLNLSVETIVQSWPVAGASVKTIFPLAELAQSMKY